MGISDFDQRHVYSLFVDNLKNTAINGANLIYTKVSKSGNIWNQVNILKKPLHLCEINLK